MSCGLRDVIEFATLQGARTDGLEAKGGTLTPGKEADIVLLRTDLTNTLPFNNAYGAIVTAMDTSNVDTVFVAGKAVKGAITLSPTLAASYKNVGLLGYGGVARVPALTPGTGTGPQEGHRTAPARGRVLKLATDPRP